MTELTLAQTPASGQLSPSVEPMQPPALVTRTSSGAYNASEALMPRSYEEVGYLAKLFANANMYTADGRQMTVPQCAVIIMTGIDLGITPSQAMRSISIIKGKPALSADLLMACVRKKTELCEYIQILECNDTICKMAGKRRGDAQPTIVQFTMDDAERAGLTKNPVYKTYPEPMLYARCSVRLNRRLWPDVALGLFTPDELREGQVDLGGNFAPTPTASEPVRQITHEAAPVHSPVPDVPTQQTTPATPPSVDLPSQSLKALRKILNDRIVALDADQKELIKQYASAKFNGKFMPAILTEEQIADVNGALDEIAADPFTGLEDLLNPNPVDPETGGSLLGDEVPTAVSPGEGGKGHGDS